LGQRFRIKKAGNFWPIEPFFEFDAGHRTKKMVKSGQKLTFLDRNGSDPTSYKKIRPRMHTIIAEVIAPLGSESGISTSK
jgi:hypothetical protein